MFNWQPDAIIESVFEDAETQDLVRKHIFQHPDWIELDRGTLSNEQAVERGAARTGLDRQAVERVFAAVLEFLTPRQQTFELVHELSGTPNRLFVLSNMSHASIDHLEREHDIWHLFEGAVISSRIQMVKPELRIFEHLLERFRLQPSETVFIDDMPENVAAAASLGIHAIRFHDAAQCRQALAAVAALATQSRPSRE